jgi:hypothetical protein
MTTKHNKAVVAVECDGRGSVGHCLGCGAVLRLKLPMPLDAAVLYMKAFVLEHSICKEPQP